MDEPVRKRGKKFKGGKSHKLWEKGYKIDEERLQDVVDWIQASWDETNSMWRLSIPSSLRLRYPTQASFNSLISLLIDQHNALARLYQEMVYIRKYCERVRESIAAHKYLSKGDLAKLKMEVFNPAKEFARVNALKRIAASRRKWKAEQRRKEIHNLPPEEKDVVVAVSTEKDAKGD